MGTLCISKIIYAFAFGPEAEIAWNVSWLSWYGVWFVKGLLWFYWYLRATVFMDSVKTTVFEYNVYFNLWLIKISWDIYCTSMNIWFRWPSQQRHPQQLPQLGNIYELVIVYTIDVYIHLLYISHVMNSFLSGNKRQKLYLYYKYLY